MVDTYPPFPRRVIFVRYGYNLDGDHDIMEEWLTTYEAANLSEYNPDYIRQLIRNKKVTGRKWGPSWQVNRRSLLAYQSKKEKLGDKRGAKPKPDAKQR